METRCVAFCARASGTKYLSHSKLRLEGENNVLR